MFSFETIASAVGLMGAGTGAGYYFGKAFRQGEQVPKLRAKLAAAEADLVTARTELERVEGLRRADAETISTQRNRLVSFEAVRETLLSDEDELWRLHPPIPPKDYFARLARSPLKVIAIANHKGGVGKTTLAANLVAFFEQELDKRVLAIDLDYQGSLTTSLLKAVGLEYDGAIARELLGGDLKASDLVAKAKTLQPKLPRSSLVTANYDVQKIENQMLMRWLLNEAESDVRYMLGALLLDPNVQAAYDVVIIDTPPRMTTGTINALLASHHIVVPVIPDGMSAVSVGRFLNQVDELRQPLNPGLGLAGVVVNMARQAILRPDEEDAIAVIRTYFKTRWAPGHVFSNHISRLVALSGVAGQDIAYLTDRNFREGTMKPLGHEIAARVGLGV